MSFFVNITGNNNAHNDSNAAAMSVTDRIKVLVLGDSGVGKTSLVHLIANNEVIKNSSWTIGTSIEVKLHEYQEGTPAQRSCFLELWDVGGCRTHFTARQIFYNGFHGLILVHDLTNRKSHDNLRKWLTEVFCSRDLSKEPTGGGFSLSAFMGSPPSFDEIDFDPETFAGKDIPVLVVGTKSDLASSPQRRSRSSSVAQECGAEEIAVDSTSVRSFAPASTNAVKLSRFLDKVVERKYNAFTNNVPSFASSERAIHARKLNTASIFMANKMSHFD